MDDLFLFFLFIIIATCLLEKKPDHQATLSKQEMITPGLTGKSADIIWNVFYFHWRFFFYGTATHRHFVTFLHQPAKINIPKSVMFTCPACLRSPLLFHTCGWMYLFEGGDGRLVFLGELQCRGHLDGVGHDLCIELPAFGHQPLLAVVRFPQGLGQLLILRAELLQALVSQEFAEHLLKLLLQHLKGHLGLHVGRLWRETALPIGIQCRWVALQVFHIIMKSLRGAAITFAYVSGKTGGYIL